MKNMNNLHCLRCKSKTANKSPGKFKNKRGNWMVSAKCGKCGTRKVKPASQSEINGGLLGSLPIIGSLGKMLFS